MSRRSPAQLIGGTIRNEPMIDVEAFLPAQPLSPPPVDRMTSGIVKDNLGRSTNIIPGDLTEGSANLRTPTTIGDSPANPIDAQNEILQKQDESYRKAQLGVAGARFAIDVINANAQYRQVAGQAQFNIQMARNQAQDSLYRGRLAAGQAKSQGRAASDQAILAMAAQGQDVSGAATQRVAGSYEAVSEQNAMQLEINSIKEALGFQLEEVNYNFQVENAKINRDTTILSSALNFGAQAYGLGAM